MYLTCKSKENKIFIQTPDLERATNAAHTNRITNLETDGYYIKCFAFASVCTGVYMEKSPVRTGLLKYRFSIRSLPLLVQLTPYSKLGRVPQPIKNTARGSIAPVHTARIRILFTDLPKSIATCKHPISGTLFYFYLFFPNLWFGRLVSREPKQQFYIPQSFISKRFFPK